MPWPEPVKASHQFIIERRLLSALGFDSLEQFRRLVESFGAVVQLSHSIQSFG